MIHASAAKAWFISLQRIGINDEESLWSWGMSLND